MQKIEKVALTFVLLGVLTFFLPLFADHLAERFYGPTWVAQSDVQMRFVNMACYILHRLVSIGVGIWLFILARRENRTPWVWLLFGMVYGLLAAVLFFVLKLCESERIGRMLPASDNSEPTATR